MITSKKNSNGTIGNRTRDLPACSALPQVNEPPRAPGYWTGFRECPRVPPPLPTIPESNFDPSVVQSVTGSSSCGRLSKCVCSGVATVSIRKHKRLHSPWEVRCNADSRSIRQEVGYIPNIASFWDVMAITFGRYTPEHKSYRCH
jgi:hypothetical protein